MKQVIGKAGHTANEANLLKESNQILLNLLMSM